MSVGTYNAQTGHIIWVYLGELLWNHERQQSCQNFLASTCTLPSLRSSLRLSPVILHLLLDRIFCRKSLMWTWGPLMICMLRYRYSILKSHDAVRADSTVPIIKHQLLWRSLARRRELCCDSRCCNWESQRACLKRVDPPWMDSCIFYWTRMMCWFTEGIYNTNALCALRGLGAERCRCRLADGWSISDSCLAWLTDIYWDSLGCGRILLIDAVRTYSLNLA